MKVTLAKQPSPAANEVSQLWLASNGPVTVGACRVIEPFPVFIRTALLELDVVPSVTVPKSRFWVDKLALGATALPVSLSCCWTCPACTLSVMSKGPSCAGSTATWNTQETWGASVPIQLPGARLTSGWVPNCGLDSDASPVLVSCTDWAGEASPVCTGSKAREAGLSANELVSTGGAGGVGVAGSEGVVGLAGVDGEPGPGDAVPETIRPFEAVWYRKSLAWAESATVMAAAANSVC